MTNLSPGTRLASDRQVRDLPEAPRDLWRIVGPGIVAAGVGLSSGEFILWPLIASQVGLVFLWGALLGVGTQFFLNMEIERYTLATGETAMSGFNRFWRHWGLVLAILVYFANLWPGWAMSSATLATYIFGGDARYIAVGSLIVIGASLTLAPVVYVALERLLFVKVAAVVVLMILAVWFAITPDSWRALPGGFSTSARIPSELGFALIMAAAAFAGAGGGQNLCQSNYIRDKGFGMGRYVPRLVSPVTGVEEAAPTAQTFIFETNAANMSRWLRWWRFANVEQALTFVLVTFATICLTSMLAHSTLYGRPNLENSVSFLLQEGRALQTLVGSWFGVLFWAIGAFSLFATSMGIVDYTSRLAADVHQDHLPARLDHLGERGLLQAGVGHGGARRGDHSQRLQPAGGTAGDLRVHGRGHHVPLLVPADRAQSRRAARRDQTGGVARRQRSSGRRCSSARWQR